MIQVEEVLDLLSKFSLDRLPSEWVINVMNSNFTEAEDIPNSFIDYHRTTNFSNLLQASIDSLRQLVDGLPLPKSVQASNTANTTTIEDPRNDVVDKFWKDYPLIIRTDNFLSFLFYHISQGQRYDADDSARDLCIKSAGLYFLVLCIPGSNAFSMFHPVLYLKSLDVLRLSTKLNVSSNSPKKKAGRTNQQRLLEERLEDDEESESSVLTPVEANRLVRLLNIFLTDFIRLSQRFSLKHSPETLDETVSILVNITRCETTNAHAVFLGNQGVTTVTSLVYNSYVALQCISNDIHGKVGKIVTLAMKHLMPHILMTSRGSSDLSLRSLGVIRDHSIIFVKYIMKQLGKVTYDGIYILVQHLCLNVPDKADFRQKTSQSVVEILRMFPIQIYSRFIKWLYKFSHNEKAGHRLFSLELISKMLLENERSDDEVLDPNITGVNSPIPNNSTIMGTSCDSTFNILPDDQRVEPIAISNFLSHKFLLGIMFSRCRDAGATVRAKALVLLAECTVCQNPAIINAMKEIFTSENPVIFTTPHIENGNINVESPIEDIADFDSFDLPNSGMVMALLRRRACDDKVFVRKSALQVLENIMKMEKNMVTKDNLKVR